MPPQERPTTDRNMMKKFTSKTLKYSPNFKRHENNIKHAWYLILCYNVIEAVPHNC